MIRVRAGLPRRTWSRGRGPFGRRSPRVGVRIAGGAVCLAAGTGLLLHVGRVLLRETRQAREAAAAVRGALLRPLPARIDGLATAAALLSADRGARVGGDLYEVIPTEHGVRVVMGDVRGHGVAAIGTVAAVLAGFREAAHDEAELTGVLSRLDRALARHLRDRDRARPGNTASTGDTEDAEDFVTVLLLEIAPDGALHALNCGHPWPYLLGVGRATPVARADPMPPLGLFPLPAELPVTACGRLLPGEALFLHTDGVEDARDGQGHFFPLAAALTEAVRGRPVPPRAVLRSVFTQLLRHAGGRPKDDIAMLVLRNDRVRTAVLRGAGLHTSAASPGGATSHLWSAPDTPPVAPAP
ncbi:PP2C family protein-serine/threonine phosphatase [Streptomyces scabiei]|nr:PP2C family protein-serine/threonine phosphatase [Streptomyces scabiei]MDX2830896.1 PP2C family protein-serine/threonine phosphatase [Streptomyces scabiei]MDX3277503.1 PP2C family protein-serine/threonine phosphatase [Streptomyces scabiei]MDX3676569.1 PP2C family protein-serine/threonine phosphatase [Streptomyces scabiei]